MQKWLSALKAQAAVGAVTLLVGIALLAVQMNPNEIWHKTGIVLTVLGFIIFWTGLVGPLFIITDHQPKKEAQPPNNK